LVCIYTEVNVKAWYIELEQDGETVSNDIVITLSDLYPGMDVVNETIDIKNLGDSDATTKYSIKSARILDNPNDNYTVNETTVLSEEVEDIISHNYPFHINMSLDKNYVIKQTGETSFNISISWPLDSGNDEEDSEWGTAAYEFQQNEIDLHNSNPEYQIRPSIQIVISVTAEQYLQVDSSSDTRYDLGDTVLFDVINNESCATISDTCLETTVIDVNNTLGDATVTLMPNPNTTYISSSYTDYDTSYTSLTNDWTVSNRKLVAEDLLKVISSNIINSFYTNSEISNILIGNLNYTGRMTTEISNVISLNGYYKFLNSNFSYLESDNCYWTNTEYDSNNAFAIKKIDSTESIIYKESKSTSCNIVPILEVDKNDF